MAGPAAASTVAQVRHKFRGRKPGYAGPSGPVYGAAGAAALAQTACYGGCTAITVRSQACCNGACTPLSYITNTNVCANPWTAGSIRLGIGAGQAQVYVAPVTVTNLGFTCS